MARHRRLARRKYGKPVLVLEYDGDALEAFVAGGLVGLHKYGGRIQTGSVEFLTPGSLAADRADKAFCDRWHAAERLGGPDV